MKLRNQKRIAAQLLKVGKKHVQFDQDNLSEIKEAITKADLRSLVGQGVIRLKQYQSQSHSRVKTRAEQKRKGRRKGQGSREGKATARLPSKREWINKVRLQRDLLVFLKEKGMITNKVYREMRAKVKGGFFRTRKHITLYLKEHNLVKQ